MEAKEAMKHVHGQMIEVLKQKHDEWVSENWKLRGMELAKRQIKDEGDMHVDYAYSVLEKEYKRLTEVNKTHCTNMYAYKDFVRQYELLVESTIGEDISEDKIEKIFGY